LLRQLEGEAAKAAAACTRSSVITKRCVEEVLRDASQEEAGAFRGPNSEKARANYCLIAADEARAAALRANPDKPSDKKAFKQRFLDVTPLA
jgi:hypothetical protein